MIITTTEAAAERDLHAWLRAMLVAWAIASPLLLLTGSREWLFTPQGFLDTWDYVGLFLNYATPEYMENSYKLARVPWILSGWLVHHTVSPRAAPYVLHAGFLLGATTGFYFLVKEVFRSTSVAALAAIVLGYYTQFHGSGGWDYHNTGAGAFYIWALFAISYAARVGTRRALLVAGAVAGLAVHTNITIVNMMPVLAVHFLALKRFANPHSSWSISDLGRAALWMIVGAAMLTGALMVASAIAGRNPVFFKPLVDMVFRFIREPSRQRQWWEPWRAEWLLAAKHLSLLFATAVASVAALLVVARTRRLGIHALLWIEFIALVVVWSFWQSIGQTALNWDYFAFPLAPHALLAASAAIDARTRPVSWWLVAVAPVILAAPLVLAFHSKFSGMMPTLQTVGAAVPAAGLFLTAFICLLLPRAAALTAFLLLFGLGNAEAAVGWDRYVVQNTCRIGAALNTAVIDLNTFLTGYDRRLHKTSLWFQDDETLPLGPGCTLNVEWLGYSLQASGVPNIADNPYPMPSAQHVSEDALRTIAAKRNRLAVLSADPEAWRAIEERAAQLDLALRPVATRRVVFENRQVMLTLADVSPH